MLHHRIKLGLQLALLVGLAIELYEAQWMNAALVLGILVVTFLPRVLARGLELSVPPQLELMAIGFVFASVHNVQANVPPENAAAMWEAVATHGTYPIGAGLGAPGGSR